MGAWHHDGLADWLLVVMWLWLWLWPTVSRPVRLGVRHSSGTRVQFLFLLEIFFRQLRVCYFVAPSLTRERVCNLLLLLVLASAVPLVSDSHRTQDHILLSQFLRLPQPAGPGSRIYTPQEQSGPYIPPDTGFLLYRAVCWKLNRIYTSLVKRHSMYD
jgi:hypothetical protein